MFTIGNDFYVQDMSKWSPRFRRSKLLNANYMSHNTLFKALVDRYRPMI